MSSKTNTFETDALKAIFNTDATGSIEAASITQMDLNLHVGGFGYDGMTATNFPVTYAGYTSVPVGRTTAQWTISGSTATLATTVLFPTCWEAYNASASEFSLSDSNSGGVIYWGSLSTATMITSGSTPCFLPGSITITED